MDLKFLEEMSNAFGPPGFEEDVVSVLKKYCQGLDFQTDGMNNVYLNLKENTGRPRIMLDAHLDEVGFIVQFIQKNGLLKVLPLGGWIASNVNAHTVVIKNRFNEMIKGITVSKPPHFMTKEEIEKDRPDLNNILVDVGASSREEVLEIFKINPGDPVMPDVKFEYNDKNNVMLGKAFDNRLGCISVVETLKALVDEDLDFDVVGAISAQEEIGTRGAKVAAQIVRPDLAIVFEGSPADDMYFDQYEAQCVMKKGVQIRYMDRGYMSNRKFIDLAEKIADQYGIKHQAAVRRGGSTNAEVISVIGKAVPCLVLGVPTRYEHSHYCFSALEDLEATIKLSIELIKNLKEENFKNILNK